MYVSKYHYVLDKISPQSRLPYPRLLYVFHVCFFVCASALITSAVITSHTLLPCDFTCSTWQLLWVLAGVATMSSLAELQLWDTKEQRQCRHTADQEWKHQTWAANSWCHKAANWLRMVSRRALKSIGMFEGPAGFSDMKYQTCYCKALPFTIITINQLLASNVWFGSVLTIKGLYLIHFTWNSCMLL